KGTAALERKTTSWIYGVKAAGLYGESRPASGGARQINALSASGQLRGDRRLTEQLSVFLLAAEETDHVKSLEHRPVGEAGVSYIWWDDKEGDFQKSTLRTDLGLRV